MADHTWCPIRIGPCDAEDVRACRFGTDDGECGVRRALDKINAMAAVLCGNRLKK